MKDTPFVYYRIVRRIALLGLTRRQVADRLGVSYGTLHNKLYAITPFTLDEAIQLKQMLAIPSTLEEAFELFPKEALELYPDKL